MKDIKFILNGQDLVFSGDVDQYVSIRKLHKELFLKHAGAFANEYSKAKNVEDIIRIAAGHGVQETIKLYLDYADYYLEKGIYDFSEEYLENDGNYDYVFDSLYEELNTLKSQLDDINDQEAYEKKRREIRKESRGRFIGGGFGLSGAISGAMKAGMLNIGTGLVHSAYNAVGNAMSSMNASSEKSSLYSESKAIILQEVFLAMQNVFDVVIEQLEINVLFDFSKSGSIVKNIDKGIIKEPILAKACLDGIKNDPFNKVYYSYFLGNPENENTVCAMAEYFGVDISDIIKTMHEAFNVYFVDSSQVPLVKARMEKIQQELKVLYDGETAEKFLLEDYYLNSLDITKLKKVIELLSDKSDFKDTDQEAIAFFENKKIELEKVEDKVNTIIDSIEREKAEAATEEARRKEVIKNISKREIAYISRKTYGCKGGNLYLKTGNNENLPRKILNNAYQRYGAKANINKEDIFMILDDTYDFETESRGILMSEEVITSSDGTVINVKEITGVFIDGRKLFVDTINQKKVQLYYCLRLEDDSLEAVTLLLSNVLDPIHSKDKFWSKIEEYSKNKQNGKVPQDMARIISNSNVIVDKNGDYIINGSYLERVNQINGIPNMLPFTNVHVGNNIVDYQIQKAIDGYLYAYSITKKDVWFQINTTHDGSRGLVISKTHILNDLGQGFYINQVKSVELCEDGHVYVVTKDGQGYYLLEGAKFAANELPTINYIISTLFYEYPARLKLR